MIKHSAVLLLETLICYHESHDDPGKGDDETYIKVYADGNYLGRYPEGASDEVWDMNTGDRDSIDLEINVTYTNEIEIQVWDQDSSTDDDKLVTLYINRDTKLDSNNCGEVRKHQTSGDAEAEYGVKFRVINNPIPTVRVLGIRCEKQSAGMNTNVADAVAKTAEKACKEAAKVIGKSPRPSRQLIADGFKAASKALKEVEEIVVWIAGLIEGKDDVYMKHLVETRGHDGGFFPKDAEVNKMEEGDEVYFEDRYGEYFRFPLDEGPVTIQLREHDEIKSDINIGTLTITPDNLRVESSEGVSGTTCNGGVAEMDGPAVIEIADSYGKRDGEGAVYHICYSVGMENWCAAANSEAQANADGNAIYKPSAADQRLYDDAVNHSNSIHHILTLDEMRDLINNGYTKAHGWTDYSAYWVHDESDKCLCFDIKTGLAHYMKKSEYLHYSYKTDNGYYKSSEAHSYQYTYDEMTDRKLLTLKEMKEMFERGEFNNSGWNKDLNYWVVDNPSEAAVINITSGEVSTQNKYNTYHIYSYRK
ncbi:hypothetical protein [Sessilibacter corallicola]|uniref:Uncharacterized protein n=1 Tax=Sessilibacter corallicola TaxID=2904075 RepID=A0ABQ0A7Q4_9GAMM